MKKHENFIVFRGNIVKNVTADTVKCSGMVFRTFHMKNIFINFPTRIWTMFLLNFVEKSNDFRMFRLYYRAVFAHNHQVCFKKAWKIQRNWAKTWFKNGVGNLMKIFFMWNVPNNYSWSLRVSAVMFKTIFLRKTMKFSWFFMFVDYCRDSYSSMHWSTALLKRTFFARARSRK